MACHCTPDYQCSECELRAEYAPIVAERDAARVRMAELMAAHESALDALQDEMDRAIREYEDAIDEHLPHYEIDDGSRDEASLTERIEYAGRDAHRVEKVRPRLALLESLRLATVRYLATKSPGNAEALRLALVACPAVEVEA